jgi:hypothetical protein
MSTVAEIEAVLPKLATEQLRQIERAVHGQVVQRADGVLYDGKFRVVAEADLIASADEAFQAYDKEEADDNRGRTG